MKLDRITGYLHGYYESLLARCTDPECGALNGPLSEELHGIGYDGDELPRNIHLYACCKCQRMFEVERPGRQASDLPEVARTIRPGTMAIDVLCPGCGISQGLEASSWPAVNSMGAFVISPIVTFGVTCSGCCCDFYFRPLAE